MRVYKNGDEGEEEGSLIHRDRFNCKFNQPLALEIGIKIDKLLSSLRARQQGSRRLKRECFLKKKKKKEIFPGEGKTLYLVDRVMKSNYNEVNDSSAPGIERCFPCMENTFVSIYRAMKRSIKGEGGGCYL